MSTHSLFSPSAASRWMACPGSMAFPENQVSDGTSSKYAADGTATHEWAAAFLRGEKIAPNATFTNAEGMKFTLDEDRASRIQGYVDDVRRRAIGGHLFVETRVDLSDYLGEGQGGTADAAIALPSQRLGIVEDLKDGSGEKVYASYVSVPATDTTPEVREPNPQLALYALGLLKDFALFGEIDNFLLVIYQPKLDHVDEFPISVVDLCKFGTKAMIAVTAARDCMAQPAKLWNLVPGEKQCRWCRAKAKCPALADFVKNATRADFEDVPAPPLTDTISIAKAYQAVPLIEQWCTAVTAEMQSLVANGTKVIGPDNQPYKFVEGKAGNRVWTDPRAAEAALVGQIGPKAYTEPKLLTAPAAAKILSKKAIWKDLFEPLIKKLQGKPLLVCGSDPRPPATVAADALDFDDELTT